jgi:carboxylate-amine ligase
VLAENRFLAARDGVDARLIDTDSHSLKSIEYLLTGLLDAVHPHAAALGCLDELEQVAALAAAPGAVRQRAYPPDERGLVRMVEGLAAVFAQ